MLHNQRTSALLDSSLQEQDGDNSGPELANLALGFLRRQYLVIIIITTALAFAASVIFLRIAPPTYTAQTRVLFGNSKAPFTQQADRGRMARQDRVIHISGSAASWGANGRARAACYPDRNNSLPGFA
jgi:hypothetical protein